MNRLLKLDPSNTVLVAQKQELLAQAVSQTEEKLSALETAQEQVAAALACGDIGADKYQAFQREIEEIRGKLNKSIRPTDGAGCPFSEYSKTGKIVCCYRNGS